MKPSEQPSSLPGDPSKGHGMAPVNAYENSVLADPEAQTRVQSKARDAFVIFFAVRAFATNCEIENIFARRPDLVGIVQAVRNDCIGKLIERSEYAFTFKMVENTLAEYQKTPHALEYRYNMRQGLDLPAGAVDVIRNINNQAGLLVEAMLNALGFWTRGNRNNSEISLFDIANRSAEQMIANFFRGLVSLAVNSGSSEEGMKLMRDTILHGLYAGRELYIEKLSAFFHQFPQILVQLDVGVPPREVQTVLNDKPVNS